MKLLTFTSSCSFHHTVKDVQNELDILMKGQCIDS